MSKVAMWRSNLGGRRAEADRLSAMAAELVRRPVAVILANAKTLKSNTLYDLYLALSGDELRRDLQTLWEAYERRADLRNEIVHTGRHAVKAQAVEACNTALDLIRHFEAVRSRVKK